MDFQQLLRKKRVIDFLLSTNGWKPEFHDDLVRQIHETIWVNNEGFHVKTYTLLTHGELMIRINGNWDHMSDDVMRSNSGVFSKVLGFDVCKIWNEK